MNRDVDRWRSKLECNGDMADIIHGRVGSSVRKTSRPLTLLHIESCFHLFYFCTHSRIDKGAPGIRADRIYVSTSLHGRA